MLRIGRLPCEKSFEGSTILGHVWALVQAELVPPELRNVAYPRLGSSFSMQQLLDVSGDESIPQPKCTGRYAVNDYCECGRDTRVSQHTYNMDNILTDPARALDDDPDIWAQLSILEGV